MRQLCADLGLRAACLWHPHASGDHGVIAKETARTLGLGTNIQDASGLPTMEADGKIPKDLGKKYGKMILDADGFAQVGGGVAPLQHVNVWISAALPMLPATDWGCCVERKEAGAFNAGREESGAGG